MSAHPGQQLQHQWEEQERRQVVQLQHGTQQPEQLVLPLQQQQQQQRQ